MTAPQPPSGRQQTGATPSPTDVSDQADAPDRSQQLQSRSSEPIVPPPEEPEPVATPKRLDNTTLRQKWNPFLKYVHERQPWIAAPLRVAASVERIEDALVIHFDDSTDCTMLRQANNVKALTEFVLNFFQENLAIRFEVPGSDVCDVHPANGLAVQQERRALAKDPLVLTALDVFTGLVGDIRIGPPHRARSEPALENNPSDEEQTALE